VHINSSIVSLLPGGGRLPLKALALAVGIWICSGSAGMAQGGGHGPYETGYEGGGPCPGFLGFGLSYHLGYGYGGYGVGVGTHGGYPFYGGRGYPHGEPVLNRFGKTSRLPDYGGPGYCHDGHSNYFEGIGPLVVDRPVVKVGEDNDLSHVSDFGPFTGMLPYPESLFAPYTAKDAGTGSSPKVSSSEPSPPATPAHALYLGIDEEPVVGPDGVRGVRVSNVYPATAAEKAGLQPGDVILSINGYRTERRGDLAWIVTNASPDKVLQMNVRKVGDGKVHTVTVQLPAEPVDTSRPPYLPPVSNGPPPASG